MSYWPSPQSEPLIPREDKRLNLPMDNKPNRINPRGNQPTFSTPLVVGKPVIPNKESFKTKVDEVLNRGWLSNHGPRVAELEARVAQIIGVPDVIAVSSGTVGIELVARALGLKGNVIVPSFTYVATAHALAWHGITPKFCDIDLESHNIDPFQVERLIDENTSAILGVHLWGRPCAVDQLQKIAKRNNLRLIFDAAHAFGCSFREKSIGSLGDAEIFSFHATKYVSTFEGGAIATQNTDLAAELRQVRNFGFDGRQVVRQIGINGKMNEISASFGLTSMENRDEKVAWNRKIYKAYQKNLSRIPGIKIIKFDEKNRPNYQFVIVEVDPLTAGISADHLAELLAKENVFCRRYFVPACHRLLPYAGTNDLSDRLTKTEQLEERVLALPAGMQCTVDAVEIICELIGLASKLSR